MNSQTEHSKKLRQKTSAERRKRIMSDGGRILNVLISPEANMALKGLTANATITSVVESLLIDATKRVHHP